MATSASYYFRANFNFVIDGYEDTTGKSQRAIMTERGCEWIYDMKLSAAKQRSGVISKITDLFAH